MQMKKLLLATLLPLLFACSDEYVLHANLTTVDDKKEIRTDEMDNDYYIRSIYVHYRAINKSNDSIFIPIGYPYDSPVTVNIKRDSLKISEFFRDYCMRFNGYRGHYRRNYFAPGDSISIIFCSILLEIKNLFFNFERSWIRVSLNELLLVLLDITLSSFKPLSIAFDIFGILFVDIF